MKVSKTLHPLAGDFAVCLCGLLLPLAYAPYNQPWLVFVVIAILFLFLVDVSARRAAVRAWLFGFCTQAVGVSWIYYSLHVFGGSPVFLAVLIIALLAAYLSLYTALTTYIVKRFFTREYRVQLLILLPAAWVVGEWLCSFMLTGFAWMMLGYSQLDTPLAGYAPVTGVLGIGWAVAVIAGLIALVVHDQSTWRMAVPVALVVFVLGWGLSAIEWTQADGKSVKVSLVQGNVPQNIKWKPGMHDPTMDMYRQLTRQHWESDVIIWPETSIPDYQHRVTGYLDKLYVEAKNNNTDLLLGIFVKDLASKRYYNSVIHSNGDVYKKRHLVPLGEFIPLRSLVGFFNRWINIPMSDIASGVEQQPLLQAAGVPLGISICFEDAFARDVRQDLPAAKLLVNVSNDAWFLDSMEPEQHHRIARMRAKESGRYMLRATNTGVSSIIAPDGEVAVLAPSFKRHVLTADVQPMSGATPFVLMGDGLVIGLIGLMLFIVYRRGEST